MNAKKLVATTLLPLVICINYKKNKDYSSAMKESENMKDFVDENYVRRLVSRNLKRLRSMQNVSQLGLALNAGLTHNFINDIENCKKGISAKTLAKLCVALNAEPHQFFLPEDMSNDKMLIYMNDFNDSIQKVINELTRQYIPKDE